jgi:hypothetical protein
VSAPPNPSKRFQGKPCPHPGHGNERYLSDNGCVTCTRERVRKHRARIRARAERRQKATASRAVSP